MIGNQIARKQSELCNRQPQLNLKTVVLKNSIKASIDLARLLNQVETCGWIIGLQGE